MGKAPTAPIKAASLNQSRLAVIPYAEAEKQKTASLLYRRLAGRVELFH